MLIVKMVKENIEKIKATLLPGVKLVAVSKFHPAEMIQEAYESGQRVFGESHVQEIAGKHEMLPKDIEWHFIGHLQTNKVKYIAPYISLIQSVDSLKLLKEIDKQAAKCGRVIDVLLQLHVAAEETKFGFAPDEVKCLVESEDFAALQHVRVVGIMAMATNTDDEARIVSDFECAHDVFESLKKSHFADKPEFCELSMGMSGDYLLAQQHGSTMVRVGSSIFGERQYA